MNYLDGWASKIGTATCGFLSRHDHDVVHRALCSDGYGPAGWKLAVFSLALAAVGLGMWRFLRPR